MPSKAASLAVSVDQKISVTKANFLFCKSIFKISGDKYEICKLCKYNEIKYILNILVTYKKTDTSITITGCS